MIAALQQAVAQYALGGEVHGAHWWLRQAPITLNPGISPAAALEFVSATSSAGEIEQNSYRWAEFRLKWPKIGAMQATSKPVTSESACIELETCI